MKTYTFKQLSKAAKQTAIEDNFYINVDEDWWDCVYQDAAEIGLEITSSDVGYRQEITGKFTESMKQVCEDIISNHGEACNTHQTAQEYYSKYKVLAVVNALIGTDDSQYDFESAVEDLEADFLKQILRDYWQNLYDEYEYLTSKEAVAETLICNDCRFTKEGKAEDSYMSEAA